jgi:hypothetical protein
MGWRQIRKKDGLERKEEIYFFLLVFRRQRRIERRGKIEVQWKLFLATGKEQKSEEINQDNEFALCFDIFLYFNI